jgi:two-component system, NarL family, sensor kinase
MPMTRFSADHFLEEAVKGGSGVTQGKTSFQLLEGGLLSTSTLSTARSIRPPKESLDRCQLEPCAGDLTTALKATERRLHRLLEDRSRIGRDLHDCVLQSLYAIGLTIETARRLRHNNNKDSQSSESEMTLQINQLIHDVRGMIRELESGTVQEFDLSSELTTLRTIYAQAGRLDVKLDLQRNAIEVLTHEEEREILNIVREALSNCARHAHATLAVVSIRMKDTRVRISIQDDGIGFVQETGLSRGYGLTNMEARAKKLGGTLHIQSKTGKGTQIAVEFSLEPLLTSI